MKDVATLCLDTLRRDRLLDAGTRVVLGVSGGVDSIVLLECLYQASMALNLQLIVAHGHHGLRENEADEDEQFVRECAEIRQLPFFSARLAVREEAELTGESIEMAGRRLRHQFLAQIAVQEGASTVALAHHADDQAELILIRLLRGAGGEGLGGMQAYGPSPANESVRLIRPLLEFDKTQIADYARAMGLSWREDASNRDRHFLRNRIRHELIPLLEHEFQPNVRTVLARCASIGGADADLAASEGRRWLTSVRRRAFAKLHPAVQRAVIRAQLWKLGHPGDFESIERLRQHPGTVTLPGGAMIARSPAGLLSTWIPPALATTTRLPVLLSRPRGSVTFEGRIFSWAIDDLRRPPETAPSGGNMVWLDADRVGQNIHLRHRQAGDRFHSLGMPHASRLQNQLVNRKIPAKTRSQLMVAETSAGEIIWVECLPPADPFKVTSTTRRRISLQVSPPKDHRSHLE